MKTNELRIGNCVYEKGRLVIIHDGFGIDHAHNFEPIPLTELWLLKFCFTINKHTYYLNDLGLSYLTTEDNFQIEYKLADSKWKLLDLKFVHQLQNLYFVLTGEELTVNN